MHTTNLRKVGGSIMLAVPPSLLDILGVTVDNTVGLTVENGHLIVKPQNPKKYILKELLEEYKTESTIHDSTPEEDPNWLNSEPTGKELI